MGITLDGDRLRLEMARRGLTAARLAHAARLSEATVCSALAGRPVSVVTLSLIAEALGQLPVIGMVDSLIGRDLGEQSHGLRPSRV